MKKKGHPHYQEVLFIDTATGHKFICGSTLQPKETETFEGKEYPVYRVPISSKSHPFFTGSQQFLDTEGRVDKFRKRYVNKKQEVVKQAEAAAEKKEQEKQTKKKAPKKAAAEKAPATKKAATKKEPAKKTTAKKKSETKTEE
jgi:large subunit ribosomal protein L31